MKKTKRAYSKTKRRYNKKVKKTIHKRKRKSIKKRKQKRRNMRGGGLSDVEGRLLSRTIAELSKRITDIEQRCCLPEALFTRNFAMSPTISSLTSASGRGLTPEIPDNDDASIGSVDSDQSGHYSSSAKLLPQRAASPMGLR